jgi:hypothetical protein
LNQYCKGYSNKLVLNVLIDKNYNYYVGDLKIFDEPDLSGALEDGEEDDLFITGSRSEVKVTSMQPDEENEESNDDLFR